MMIITDITSSVTCKVYAFSALTLLVGQLGGRKGIRPVKNLSAGMVI